MLLVLGGVAAEDEGLLLLPLLLLFSQETSTDLVPELVASLQSR